MHRTTRPSRAEAEAALAAQPFSRLLGARLGWFGDGRCTVELGFDERLCQQDGFVHGGVLAYLADNAITFAAGSVLGPHVLTSSVSVEYLRPVVSDIRADGAVIAVVGRVAVCQAVLTSDGEVCAVGHGSARRVAGGGPSTPGARERTRC